MKHQYLSLMKKNRIFVILSRVLKILELLSFLMAYCQVLTITFEEQVKLMAFIIRLASFRIPFVFIKMLRIIGIVHFGLSFPYFSLSMVVEQLRP
jgi:hypothetical protein